MSARERKRNRRAAAAAIHDRETYHNGESLFFMPKISTPKNRKNFMEKCCIARTYVLLWGQTTCNERI